MLAVKTLVELINSVNDNLKELEKDFSDLVKESRDKCGSNKEKLRKFDKVFNEVFASKEDSVKRLKKMRSGLQDQLRDQLGDFTPEDIKRALEN